MSNNEENIKIKLSLDNLFPKTENKTDPSDVPPQSKDTNIPLQDVKLKISPLKGVNATTDKKDSLPQSSSNSEQSISPAKVPAERGEEKLSLNLFDTQKEKNKAHSDDFKVLSSTDGGGHTPDSVKLKLKPKIASPSTFSSLTSEEKPEENTSIEKNGHSGAHDSIGSAAIKPAKKSIKYFYIVGALAVIIMMLLYFLISAVITLMTI